MWRDLVRALRASPLHTAIVVGIFAVGSAAALTVFRIADVVLLRSLPYEHAERIVHIGMHLPVAPTQEFPYSDVGYRALEHRNHVFASVASYRIVGVNVTASTTPERLISARVTGSFFGLLGLRPQVGRLFAPGEESLKSLPVIVLSDALWRRRFDASPSVIGRVVRVDGEPATIVGVADPRCAFPSPSVDYWTLLDLDATGTAPFQLGLEVIARLKPGVSTDAGFADASRIIREVAHENPGPHSTPTSDFSGFRAIVRPLRDDIAGGIGPTLALLGAAVVFVLGLTCANVATLELVRANTRRTELAVRSALGAGRRRLVGGAVAEGTVRAAIGGFVGIVLSGVTVDILKNLMPAAFAGGASAELSVGIIVVALAMVLVFAASSAVFPALAAKHADLQSALRDRNGSSTKRSVSVRRSLVVVQIAFACILVDGAALMFTAVQRAQQVSLGFDPERVTLFQLSLPIESYRDRGQVVAAYRTLTDKLRSLGGVTAVGLSTSAPLSPEHDVTLVGVEGRPFKADGSDPSADLRVVSAGYFDALHISIQAGRGFREGDSYAEGTPVIISRSLAATLFAAGDDPLGHRIRTGPFTPWMSIIGVANDVRNRSLTEPSRPELYLPFGAERSPVGVSRDMTIIMKSSAGALATVTSAAQRAVLEANPDLPIYGVRRFDDVMATSQFREVTTMRALRAFAVIALALAVVGSYAVLMSAVAQRRRELALRQAVGATGADIVALVGREAARLLGIGMAVGFVGTLLLSTLLGRFLFGVSALDPLVTLSTLAVVSVAGFGAALVPALRAASVDPMLILRSD